MVLGTLIQEMKNIMQRDLNRKMVENVAFATFDEWWERKETKAKPFQTMVRGVSALRDDEKKEEKINRPREPHTSLVDWAKSGGMEGLSLRGPVRLPSFKRPRPSTPPDEDDEARAGRMPEASRHGAERDNKRRKKKPRSRKPWELGSEGEETSDGSSTEKEDEEEEGSEKASDDDALSADSDDESLSSSSDGSSSSGSTSSSSSEDEDEEEGERAESEGPDSMDDSTMDSTSEKHGRENNAGAFSKAEVKTGETKDSKPDTKTAPSKRPPSPPYPRPSSPIVLVPPLKKRRKTVSFSTGENDSKMQLPTAPVSPSPSQLSGTQTLPSPLLHHPHLVPLRASNCFPLPPNQVKAMPSLCPRLDTKIWMNPKRDPLLLLRPPLSNPLGNGVGSGKDSPKSPIPPGMVCRTVQNLPLDHASLCRMAFEEAPPNHPANKRSRGRPRTTSLSASSSHSLREEDEDEEESEQRLRLREQLGASSLLQLASASTTDLSVLADVALKMDPDTGDSEETETSDEAEEQKMEGDLFSSESLSRVMSQEGIFVITEHNYCKHPVLTVPSGTKRTSSKQDPQSCFQPTLTIFLGCLKRQRRSLEKPFHPEEIKGNSYPQWECFVSLRMQARLHLYRHRQRRRL
ncbi:hypothetical protein F7725_003179 [Dissostichus mawsoni]|uniref:Uncharacterized protein n=1 Tax=Dissostichus mawsoni TaxID=36200 RepID=A0A7J5YAV4_DISMA|nr:hypothetical protein F7725_003179 [Dissostichus mawsoni]